MNSVSLVLLNVCTNSKTGFYSSLFVILKLIRSSTGFSSTFYDLVNDNNNYLKHTELNIIRIYSIDIVIIYLLLLAVI